MSNVRMQRASRAVTASGFATFAALLSHLLGGGAMPNLAGVAIPAILAVLVCLPLSAAKLSLWRLSVSVITSQLLFHLLFGIGAASGSAPATSRMHDMTAMADMSGMTVAHHHHDGALMWGAHLVAAVVTIAALHRGESALIAIAELAARVIGRLVRMPAACPRIVPIAKMPRIRAARVQRPRDLFCLVTSPLRGPPAALSL